MAALTASLETCEQLKREVDEAVCEITPEPFHGVGAKCEDFSHTTDEEVRGLLARQRETVPETIDTALVEAVRQSLRKFTGSRQDYDPSWT